MMNRSIGFFKGSLLEEVFAIRKYMDLDASNGFLTVLGLQLLLLLSTDPEFPIHFLLIIGCFSSIKASIDRFLLMEDYDKKYILIFLPES